MLMNMRNGMMAGKRLPYDAEIEYLESTGTQWIDTGITPPEDAVITARFTLTSDYGINYIFSATTDYENGLYFNGTTLVCFYGGISLVKSSFASNGTIFTLCTVETQ